MEDEVVANVVGEEVEIVKAPALARKLNGALVLEPSVSVSCGLVEDESVMSHCGVVVPKPVPASIERKTSVPPLEPTWPMMASAPTPVPDVDFRVSVEPAAVPPITRGAVMLVVKVGVVPKTATPLPVSSWSPAISAEEGAE